LSYEPLSKRSTLATLRPLKSSAYVGGELALTRLSMGFHRNPQAAAHVSAPLPVPTRPTRPPRQGVV